MNLESWAQAATIVVPLTTLIGFFWNSLNKKFDKIDERFNKIDEKFEVVRDDIHEVKERITYLEASNTFFNIVPTENARSEAAKRSWKAKKAKQLAKLEKK